MSNNMLETLVVHIGSHKSGSTAIQDFAYSENAFLLSRGIYYPMDVFKDYPRQHSSITKLLVDEEQTREFIERISSEAIRNTCNSVFLSGEDLCTIGHDRISTLKRVCERYFKHLKFVIVLRARRDFLLSNFKHNLRYSAPLSELAFSRSVQFSPLTAIENWREHFSLDAIFLHYDHIKSNLVPEFFASTFSLDVDRNPKSNVSLDYLTLTIYNVFLNEWRCREIDLILWHLSQRHKSAMTFSLENEVAKALADGQSEKDWNPIEYRGARSLLAQEGKFDTSHDPIEVCDKMLELFGQLRDHFAKLSKAGE